VVPQRGLREAGGFSPNGFPFLNGLSDPDRFRLVTVLLNGNPVSTYIIVGGPKATSEHSAFAQNSPYGVNRLRD
jgi:hypothetical protein